MEYQAGKISPPWQPRTFIDLPPMTPKLHTQYRSFLDACMNGDRAVVLNLVDTGPCRSYFLQEGLHRAICANDISLATVLLELGAPVNSTTASAATWSKSLPMLKLLVLKHGLNVNLEISRGENMLREVIEDETLVQWLLEQGSAVDPMNGRNPGGENMHTSLDAAASHSSLAVVNLLLKHGANKAISTPLHFAAGASQAVSDRIPIMARLIEAGFDVNASDEIRWPSCMGVPLVYAMAARSLPRVEFLLDQGARPREKVSSSGSDPLTQAENVGLTEMVAALKKRI